MGSYAFVWRSILGILQLETCSWIRCGSSGYIRDGELHRVEAGGSCWSHEERAGVDKVRCVPRAETRLRLCSRTDIHLFPAAVLAALSLVALCAAVLGFASQVPHPCTARLPCASQPECWSLTGCRRAGCSVVHATMSLRSSRSRRGFRLRNVRYMSFLSLCAELRADVERDPPALHVVVHSKR